MTLSFPMLGTGWCNLDGSVRACVNSEHRKAVRLREEEKGERERGEIGGDGRSSRGISCAHPGVDSIQVRSALETPSGPIVFLANAQSSSTPLVKKKHVGKRKKGE